jgi:hypothetical protein
VPIPSPDGQLLAPVPVYRRVAIQLYRYPGRRNFGRWQVSFLIREIPFDGRWTARGKARNSFQQAGKKGKLPARELLKKLKSWPIRQLFFRGSNRLLPLCHPGIRWHNH